MKLKILTIFLLFVCTNRINSQCEISQYIDESEQGPNNNSSTGQSLRACEQGTVTYLAFKVMWVTTNALARIELYQGNSYNNLVRTVDNYVPHLGWNIINIDSGIGPSYLLNSDEVFRMRIWNITSNDVFVLNLSTTNPYSTGDFLAPPFGTPISGWDLAFRFSMNGAPLPIELSNFKAELINNEANLIFLTSSEINNAGFDIERSSDGFDFQKIGWVDGHGSTTEEKQYSFTDTKPLLGMNYYRLRQMDYDGRFEYSHIVSVEQISDGVYLYPNPATDILHIHNLAEGDYLIKSIAGTIVGQGVLTGDSRLDISHLPQGTYLFYPDSGRPLIFNKL